MNIDGTATAQPHYVPTHSEEYSGPETAITEVIKTGLALSFKAHRASTSFRPSATGAGRLLADQSTCRYFQSPQHISRLTDSQTAALDMAFGDGNIGPNITIKQIENTSDKLRQTAEWINIKLGNDCPTGLQLDLNRIVSADSNDTIYQSQSKSVRGTIALPVRPESLSFIDNGAVSCLYIDVKTANGQTARVDILNVTHALEQEYACRVRAKFRWPGASAVCH